MALSVYEIEKEIHVLSTEGMEHGALEFKECVAEDTR